MMNRYHDRKDYSESWRFRQEKKRLKARNAVATVVAIFLVTACIASITVIGVTIVDNILPDSNVTAATEITKLGMISADAGIQTATQASPRSFGGSALHIYGKGKTSEGYNWDYSADNDIVKVACSYDFHTNTYDLTVTGKAAGTANVTLCYFTDDNAKVSVPMAVSVDNNLNITQI